MNKDYEILFTPFKIGSCELKNRFVMVPMEPTALFDWNIKPGGFNKKTVDLLVNRAKDGVGLIIPGAVMVYSTLGRKYLGDHPEAFKGVKEFTDEIHSHGTKIFVQLAAGMGRNFPVPMILYKHEKLLNLITRFDKTTASSDAGLPNRFIEDYKTKEMTVKDIKRVIKGFADAAYLCKQNGIDGVDVHAVHEGYLMDQFATQYTNHRTDEYGGALENRLRFACEVVKAIKEKCGQDYPVILRYSVESKTKAFGKGIIPADKVSKEIGRDFEESKEAIRILTEAGYDGFNADNGTYDAWYYAHPPVYMPLNCNLPEVRKMRPYTDKAIICAGRMQLKDAAEAIRNGEIDFVGIGRQFLCDEKYLTKIRNDQEEDVIPCISCHLGCMPVGLWQDGGKDTGAVLCETGFCALNPYTNNEKKYAFRTTKNPKKIAVIGAGISGMEFALQATKRGHSVEIFEKSDRLGGVFNEAAYFSFKEKDRDLLTYYATQMKKHNIPIHLNTEIHDTQELDFEEIVIATGSLSERTLPIPGSELAVSAVSFLKNNMASGDRVAVVGGGLTGCEIAYELAMQGKHPFIIEMQDDILKVKGSSMANTSYLRDAFEYYQVPVYTNAKTTTFTKEGVTLEQNGEETFFAADTIVVSIGYKTGVSLKNAEGKNIHVIGDAKQVSNLLNATRTAYDAVLLFD